MLETTDFDSLGQRFPFFAAIKDVMCRSDNEPETTKFPTE